ncbi:C39 family peptidase [Fredinandcohnia humi]
MKKIVGIILFLNLICVIYLVGNVDALKGIASGIIAGSKEQATALLHMSTRESNQYKKTVDGITEVLIPVDTVLQLPELPNGCEITSLTSILHFYGYPVSKTDMADNYLPKEPFIKKNNILYGADPYKAYAGNPREKSGFFSYAPPIVTAANSFFKHEKSNMTAVDMSGSSREEIMKQIDRGNPVVIWVTLDLSEPKLTYAWKFHDNGQHFSAPTNLHSVVLNGYVGDKVHVMDPLKGQVTYDAGVFFESYYALGSHAMMIKK